MLEYLEQAFGDPDRAQNAQNQLFHLRQKNLDFSTYFSEFQRLALEGEMPGSALTPLLFQGISRELQDMLLHNPPPSQEFADYANHLQKLDNRFRQHQQQVSRNRAPPARTSPVNYTAAAKPTPNVDRTPKRPASPYLAPPTPAQVPEPMDLSAQRTPRLAGRKERGECFRCGSRDHRVAQCPEPDNRPTLHSRPSSPAAYPAIRTSSIRSPSPPGSPIRRYTSPPPSLSHSLNGVSLG